MELDGKLAVLADAAKYDASCASSGSKGRRASSARGMGSTEGMGVCHSYTPDGRCVSLLKVLLTNYCVYDCAYCINRRSSSVERARFMPAMSIESAVERYNAVTEFVSRVLRTRLGPLALERHMPRGRFRELSDEELMALTSQAAAHQSSAP